MSTLSTSRTTSNTAAEHVSDHNILHAVNNILDAKGDIPVATAADTWSKVAVGTNDYVLTADSAQATGVKWAPSGTTALVGAKVYRSAAYNVPNAAATALPCDAEEFDTDGFHDNASSNTRLTVPSGKAGYYLVGACWTVTAQVPDTKRAILQLQKNGADIRGGRAEADGSGASSYPALNASAIVSLAVGDYVEAVLYQDSGGTLALDTARAALWAFLEGT